MSSPINNISSSAADAANAADSPDTELNSIINERMSEVVADEALRLAAEIDESNSNLEELMEKGVLVNRQSDPVRREGKTLKERRTSTFKAEDMKYKLQKIPNLDTVRKLAEERKGKFQELELRKLLAIFDKLSPGMKREDVLKLIKEEGITDPTLMEEVLDFLAECTSGELQDEIKGAKQELYKTAGREAKAGQNIATQTKAYSQQGLGEAGELRQLYRNVTEATRDTQALFEELLKKFEYVKMKSAIEFLLHSLGADMNASGPSVERAFLHKLLTEIRSLQAILGVYRFFEQRYPMLVRLSARQGSMLPATLIFSQLARFFMLFIANRYPSAEKLLKLAKELGISEDILLEILVYSQFRDAMRYISPRLFYTQQHRDDIYLAILEALEELEQMLDEGEVIENEEEEDEESEEAEGTEAGVESKHSDDLDDPFLFDEKPKINN